MISTKPLDAAVAGVRANRLDKPNGLANATPKSEREETRPAALRGETKVTLGAQKTDEAKAPTYLRDGRLKPAPKLEPDALGRTLIIDEPKQVLDDTTIATGARVQTEHRERQEVERERIEQQQVAQNKAAEAATQKRAALQWSEPAPAVTPVLADRKEQAELLARGTQAGDALSAKRDPLK